MNSILIVGAAGGVGLEVVKDAVARGDTTYATVLNSAEADLVREAVGDAAAIIELDLSNAQHVLDTLKGKIDQLDHVVVCAAIGPYGPVECASLSLFQKTLEINTISNLAVFQATMPLLRESKGRFVFISSFAGKVALPFIGLYASSKHALEGLADAMRREVARWGVKVVLVEPGAINTPMVTNQKNTIAAERAKLTADQEALYGDMFDTYTTVFTHGAGSGMPPSQVAGVIANALSAAEPQARYVVGEDSKQMCEVIAKMPEGEGDAVIDGFLKGL